MVGQHRFFNSLSVGDIISLAIINYGTISTVEYPDFFSDVIYFSHVIEHLENPKKELTRLKKKRLKPCGHIICGFPLYDTVEWNWDTTYYDVPRHHIHIEKKTDSTIFSNAGFIIKRIIYVFYGQGFHQNYCLSLSHYGMTSCEMYFIRPVFFMYRLISLILSFIHQSGNVIYYLGKKKVI